MKDSEAPRQRGDSIFWHAASREEVFERLGAATDGLAEEEAEILREQYGKNTLPVKKPPTLAAIFLHQLARLAQSGSERS